MFTVPVKPQLPSQTHNNNEHAVTSLRERLKDLSAHDDADAKKKDVQPQQPSASFKAPKTPKYLDVTTAFFSGPIVRGHEEKTQPEHKFRTPQIPVTHTPTTYPPRGHRKLQQRQQHQTPQQQQPRESESTRGFSIVESPDAQALVQAVANQSNHLFDKSVSKLGKLDGSLRQTQQHIKTDDDQLLKLIEESTRRYCKPLSDTMVIDSYTDDQGVVSRQTVHIGERVAMVKDRLEAVEAELNSLWAEWEDAQAQVDIVLAEIAQRHEQKSSDTSGSTTAVKESLARELASFEQELKDILDSAHEEARIFERNFSRQIQSVQHSFLQDYMLED